MAGFAILLSYNLLGLFLEHYLHIPLPGNVIGLILFTLSLFLRIIKLEWVESSAQFLLSHLSIFFAPIIVGTIAILPLIRQSALSFVVSIVASTLITLLITGWVTGRLMRKEATEVESR